MVKNIVIIGGSFAGTQTAIALEKALSKANDQEHHIILIEKVNLILYDNFETEDKMLIPYTNLFQDKRHKTIKAKASEFYTNKIILDQQVPEFGNEISYDYLIIATGTDYPAPFKSPHTDYQAIVDGFRAAQSEIKAARSILIVGGGPVGIELAGEIREHYPEKRLVIVHSESNYLNDAIGITPKMRSSMNKLLSENHVENVFNTKAVVEGSPGEPFYKPQGGTVNLINGSTVENIDLVFMAAGNRPGTSWLKHTEMGRRLIKRDGYIKVKSTLQVDDPIFPHVFTLGDVAGLEDPKMANIIKYQTAVLVENLSLMALHNQQPSVVYSKHFDGIFVSFGSNKGSGYLKFFGGLHFGSWVVSTIKGKTLFVEKAWKGLNVELPTKR
ncbi:hypothetical protein EDC96DRAFT_466141 [Choanephora cucurbitarum]|nr:hypothetical protein EDC96DRAFT_466141 [Choanephora cucurbitarum]